MPSMPSGDSEVPAEDDLVGDVGVAALSLVLFLLSRLTSFAAWNCESCIFSCAREHTSSSLKLANAQLLLEMRKSDSNSPTSRQTWATSVIKSV